MPDWSALALTLRNRLLTDSTQMVGYTHDTSRVSDAGQPGGVVLAESTSDVSEALKWATKNRVPVSVRGAGTGLVGGANAYPNGLVISLASMNRILSIDPENRIAVVEPGVITADLDAAAQQHGLFFPPDPASASISTVGGNIATNAGGLRCVAHGVTADSVAALEVVLADGRILHTGALTRKNVVGYDLTRLFVGSEGTLGIITSATVRLKPVPTGTPHTFRVSFDSLAAAGAAVTKIVGGSIPVEALELMDALTVGIVESFAPTGLAVPRGALLIGQTVGDNARADAESLIALCEAAGGTDTELSTSSALLDSRRQVNPALNANGIKVSCDAGVPVAQLAAMFTGVESIAESHGAEVSTVAHAGDGNLHCTVMADDSPTGLATAELVLDDITRLALSLGGTITGEHGIGSVKHHELSWQLDEVALDVHHAIKHALDPHHILTPGRGV